MTHIENDVIMAQQWCKRLNDGVHWRLKIICDDTDNVAFAFSSNREHSSSWNQLQIGLLLTLEYHSINIQQKRKLFQSVDATVYTAWWVLESWSPWLPWRRKGWFTWATWVQQEKILWLKHQNFTVYVTTLQRKRYVWKKVMVYITFQCFQSPMPSTIILYEKTMCPKILISFYKISFQVPPSSSWKVVSSTKVVLVATSEWSFCSECFESLLSVHYLAINTWSWSPSYGQNNFRAWEWRNKWVTGSGDASSQCVCSTRKSAGTDDPRI